MPAEPLLVGVDVGTTNIKAIVYTPQGETLAEASVHTPTYVPQPAWAYHRPEELWQCTAAALRQATAQLDDARRIAGLAVASMGEAGVPLDARGEPTYDAIAWFDRRTQPQVEWLERTVGRDRLAALTGVPLQPIFGLCKLLWLKENEPEAFARTVSWLNIADFIAYRLCGVAATDYSLASRTLALDLRRRRWAGELLEAVGIPAGLFAPLVPSGTGLGPVTAGAAAVTGLPAGAQAAAGGHDHDCGALAAGVTEPGAVLNSLGTAEAIFVPLERPLADPAVAQQGYAQGVHVVADRYYVHGGLYTSGACIEWFREALGGGADYATLIAEAAQVPPGSLGVYFVPHLRLANPPHDDPRARGAFVGLNADVKRGTLFRAVLEGLAYESRLSLESLLAYPDVAPLRRLCAIGGNTRNRLLMGIKATVLRQPITVADVADATALGAALLGGLGAGVYRDVPAALAAVRLAQSTVEPVVEQVARYDAWYHEVYQRIYPALRPLYHTIHRLHGSG